MEDNNAANTSESDDIKREREREIERQRKRKELEEELLREPPFRASCIKAAELAAYNRYPNSERNTDKVQKDVRKSVEEEIRKQNQARYASILARNTAERLSLLGDSNSVTKNGCDQKMEMDKMTTIIKLTGVTIFPKVDGQGEDNIVGTLEAHDDRFIYTTSTSYFHSQLTYEYDNVIEVFYQGEDDEDMLPLLHFRLYNPIKVGTEKREHVQFRLVPTAVVERLSDNDLDKFQKNNQTIDSRRNKDLEDFRGNVEMKWWGSCPPFSFRRVSRRGEFLGVMPPKKSSDVFVFTFASLLQLANTPFVVVNLQDIAIVHLARLRPEEIDMTVVFTDFNRPVLQISSIPLDTIEELRSTLDRWGAKFYENNLYLDWVSILKNMKENPETFIQEGGWNAYELEDSATLLYYMHYCLELSQAPVIKFEDRIIE